MVLLGVYKNNWIFQRNFLKAPVLKFRAWTDYYWCRAWNAQFCYIVVGEVRYYVILVPLIYYYCRYRTERVDTIESFEKVLIKRWGGTVDAVRKNLTPGEQVIARNFFQWEQFHSTFGPDEIMHKPAGCPLPGPEAAH